MSAAVVRKMGGTDLRRMLDLVSETSRQDVRTQAPSVHALRGLVELTRSRVGIIAHVRRIPNKSLQIDSFVDTGWEGAMADRSALIQAAMDPSYVDAVLDRGFDRFENRESDSSAFLRRTHFSDKEWYSSMCYAEHRKPARIDDCVYCIYYLGQTGHYACLGLHRGVGDRTPFSERDRQVADYVWQALGWMHRLPLGEAESATKASPVATLDPELLTAFRVMTSRGSLARAHRKLGLTKAEFERRIRNVYRHFGVSSRLELLARLVDEASL